MSGKKRMRKVIFFSFLKKKNTWREKKRGGICRHFPLKSSAPSNLPLSASVFLSLYFFLLISLVMCCHVRRNSLRPYTPSSLLGNHNWARPLLLKAAAVKHFFRHTIQLLTSHIKAIFCMHLLLHTNRNPKNQF